jgi:hypothetical protein
MLGTSFESVKCILKDDLNMCWIATKFVSNCSVGGWRRMLLAHAMPFKRDSTETQHSFWTQSQVMTYGFMSMTHKPRNSCVSGTAPSSSHPNSARQGCSNVNNKLMLLPDIHGVNALWICSPKTNWTNIITLTHYGIRKMCGENYLKSEIQGLASPPQKNTSPVFLCMHFWLKRKWPMFHTLPDHQI